MWMWNTLQRLNSDDWDLGNAGRGRKSVKLGSRGLPLNAGSVHQPLRYSSWASISSPAKMRIIIPTTCGVVLRIHWGNLMYGCNLHTMIHKCQTKQIVTSLRFTIKFTEGVSAGTWQASQDFEVVAGMKCGQSHTLSGLSFLLGKMGIFLEDEMVQYV